MITLTRLNLGVLSVFLLLLLVSVPASALSLNKTSNISDTKKFSLGETTWQKLMEEPASHFLRAKESLLKNNKKDAARNIRKGVNIINIEITRASKNMKPKLSNVAGELLIFAQDLSNNKEIVTGGLERAFLRAESILSQHKLAMADRFISEDSLNNAVYALEAASRHLLYSQIWSPQKLSTEDAESIKVTQEKMLHLIDGEKWDREQIISTRNMLKQMLDKI